MPNKAFLFLLILSSGMLSCKKADTTSPVITLYADANTPHYRNVPYTDPGARVLDNHTCDLNIVLNVINSVDVSRYGSYSVVYTAEDAEGNSSELTRTVDIVLPVEDYYSLNYDAHDSCSYSGSYSYIGLIQDCDCPGNYATVGNISNFGLSANFSLPVSGNYNEMLLLDTTRFAVHFEGSGIMSPDADSIYWQYSISDSVNTDVCTSVWVKN